MSARVKIPPVKMTLRIMDGIGADNSTNSLPNDAKARYLKDSTGEIRIDGIDSVEDVQTHRATTDRLLLQADQTLLKISTDQLFLPTYYTKENLAVARTHSNMRKQPTPRRKQQQQQAATARGLRTGGASGGGGGTTPRSGALSSRGPSTKKMTPRQGGKDGGGDEAGSGGGACVPLPPINTKHGVPSKWHMRHQAPVPLESDFDLQLAKLMAEEESSKQQSIQCKNQQAHPGGDGSSVDGESESDRRMSLQREDSLQVLGATQRSAVAGDNTTITAAAMTPGHHQHKIHQRRGSAALTPFFPWWDLARDPPLEEASKKRCEDCLIKAPEICKVSWADFEYRAAEFISCNPEAEAYDFMVDQEVSDALGREGESGSQILKDLMEAVGGIEQGLSLASDGVMNSELTGHELRVAATEVGTGLVDILEEVANAKGTERGGPAELTTRGLDEGLLFHWELRSVPQRSRLMQVHRIRSKALQWLQSHFERVDSDLREDFEANR